MSNYLSLPLARGVLTLFGTKARWAKIGNISLALAALCGGCTIMPASGPQSMDVRMSQAAEPESLPYALVKLEPEVVRILAQYTPRLSTAFANRTPPKAFRFGIGDTVSVTIFESAAGGLFIPAEAGVRPGNFVTIPPQAVDNNGNITVPYAGAIRARDKTPVEIQQAIVAALKNRAIEPQAVVSLVEQRASLISVLGDVRAAGRFPASASGERILDAITRAGGPSTQGYDTWVTLERAGHRASVPFGSLVYEPSNNIYVIPNDTIYLYNQPQTFVAFGAAGTQGQYKFDAWRITLAEAVGKHGGLNDSLADPASIFLYRGETREVAERLGVDCSKFQGPIIPIIYNVNFRDPSGYFMAQSFEIRNKDVIYTSNSSSVETTKFLNYLRTIMATANDPIVYATNAYALKAAIKGGVPAIINPATPVTTP
ncbi:MAG: polysaccharide export protein [Afipia sp.]|nr:polysaccharide export protein [Afipia sp.]